MSDRTVTRRRFLLGAGIGTLSLSLWHLGFAPRAGAVAETAAFPDAAHSPDYHGWEDLYRQRWVWDSVAKGTHHVNCWYQRGCNWNVYVKDGIVWREEQVAKYPRTNAAVPDFNPRGCQKGACYSHRMYDSTRLTYPLKRVGARGDGRWERVTWDEALTEIADRVIDVLRQQGPGAIYWDMGGGNVSGGHGVGLFRTRHLLDTIVLSLNSEVGDHHPGASVTCGKIDFTSSADDWFYSDLILIWGGNPLYTQIPNAHFLTEARYHGTRVVCIAPDLNASAIHTDLWVPVNIGTDAALGLGLAHVILAENLHDPAFIREQTDLALLVRSDTRRFLRASDLEENGAPDEFYVYDTAAKAIHRAPRRTLALDSVTPALDGVYSVRTLQGPVMVTPAFELLRQQVQASTPETVARITGVAPAVTRALARQIATAKSATILTQSNFSKFYHGVEMERVQFLVLALCGHFGRKGSGMNAFASLTTDANEAAGIAPSLPMKLALAAVGVEKAGAWLQAKWQGRTNEMFVYEETRKAYATGGFVSATLFFHRYGGLAPQTGSARRWDPHLTRELDAFLDEAAERGWQQPPTTEPKILFEVGGNILQRVRGYDRLIDGLLPRLDLLVTVDSRMSATARYSDFVLPAAAWYERADITWATPLAPFSQVTTVAAAPRAEAKADWVFHCLLMKMIQERAVARGQIEYNDRAGTTRRLDHVYDDLTFGRRYTEEDPEALLRALLEVNSNTGGAGWDTVKNDGCVRFTAVGMSPVAVGNATDIEPDQTITACTWHTAKKMPWPTLTRRMQFYIDHEWYLELGEVLPVHKDNPAIGGDYPLQMTGGHTRWSIHASWRDSAPMLRLQRGRPVMYMSQEDARARGIRDGNAVRVHNDVGSFEIHVKVSAAVRPGQVIVYHAWEPSQFAGGRTHQVLIPAPINPIQLAGGYYHLQPTPIVGEPGMPDRGTRVEVVPIAGS